MGLIEFKDLPDTSTPLNAENLNNNFNELKGEKVWTNPNPTNDFDENEIQLDLSEFDYIEIITNLDSTINFDSSCFTKSLISEKGNRADIFCKYYLDGIGNAILTRTCFVYKNKIHFKKGYYFPVDTAIGQEANYYLIPLYIIGYKTGIFN